MSRHSSPFASSLHLSTATVDATLPCMYTRAERPTLLSGPQTSIYRRPSDTLPTTLPGRWNRDGQTTDRTYLLTQEG